MADIRGVAVADDVRDPFVAGGVCVACADVAGLHGLQVLDCAKFVGHFGVLVGEGICEGKGCRVVCWMEVSLG